MGLCSPSSTHLWGVKGGFAPNIGVSFKNLLLRNRQPYSDQTGHVASWPCPNLNCSPNGHISPWKGDHGLPPVIPHCDHSILVLFSFVFANTITRFVCLIVIWSLWSLLDHCHDNTSFSRKVCWTSVTVPRSQIATVIFAHSFTSTWSFCSITVKT